VGQGTERVRSKRLLDALAGDGDQAEVVELEDLGGGAIGFEGFFEGGHDLEAVLAVVHVDEVDDDDAAEVAEANLADDLGDGVEVGLDDGVLKAGRLADVLAGVDVDGDERFGLVDDDGSAALEPDLGAESLGDFVLNAEVLEERRLLGVELDAAHQGGREAVEEADDALVVGFRIDPDVGEVAADLVAQDALDQPESRDRSGRATLKASERCLISVHRFSSMRRSARSSSSDAPSAAVRTINPPEASPRS
jgi:hypothetical protein